MVVALVAVGIAIAGTATASSPRAGSAKVKSTFTRVKGGTETGSSGEVIKGRADCPSGYRAFGGGYIADGIGVEPSVQGRYGAPTSSGYLVTLVVPPVNISAGIPKQTVTLQVLAYCVKTGQPLVITSGQ
jgi:hypothetical protein